MTKKCEGSSIVDFKSYLLLLLSDMYFPAWSQPDIRWRKDRYEKKCNTSYDIHGISWFPPWRIPFTFILFFLGNPVHTWKYICTTLYHVFLHLSGAITNKSIRKQLFSFLSSNLIRSNLPTFVKNMNPPFICKHV